MIYYGEIQSQKTLPFVPDPSSFVAETAIGRLKKYQIVVKFWQHWFKQEVKHYSVRCMNSFIVWNKHALPDEWKKSITVSVYKKRG
jgi:hypothetical protein